MEPRNPSADIHRSIVEHCDAGHPFAVVTVLRTEGSTPAKAGVKAAVDDSGRIAGTIGGGAVEAEAQRRAVVAIQRGEPSVFDFDLNGAGMDVSQPVCGGAMRVLVDSTAPSHRSAFTQAADARAQRRRGVLLTTVRGAHPPQVSVHWLEEDALETWSGFPAAGEIRSALREEEPTLIAQESTDARGRVEILIEPLVPRPRLLIVGGGHVGQAVAQQASLVGFDITVVDDRPEFTQPGLFPEGVVTRCGNIPEEVAAFPFTHDTFVVLVTRGHQHDAVALAACIRQPAAYVGMIGSRRKVALMRQEFIASGRASEAEFSRVHAPIGLDIGSVTVPEIATSILAQLIAIRRKGSAPRMPTA